jgi:hypothetical protein
MKAGQAQGRRQAEFAAPLYLPSLSHSRTGFGIADDWVLVELMRLALVGAVSYRVPGGRNVFAHARRRIASAQQGGGTTEQKQVEKKDR